MKGTKRIKIIFFIFALFLINLTAFPVVQNKIVSQAATIKISNRKMNLTAGQKKYLRIRGTNKKILWKSSNVNVAKVNQNGLVRGVDQGKAIISARVNGQLFKCIVIVKRGGITKVEFDESLIILEMGDAEEIIPTTYPYNATDELSWESSNEDIASIYDGTVYAESPGTAVITASINGKKAACVVTVKESGGTNNDYSNNDKVDNNQNNDNQNEKYKNIEYISDLDAVYYSDQDLYKIFFSLKFKDNSYADASGTSDIKIVDNNGKELFNNQIDFTENNFSNWTNKITNYKRYLCSIDIKRSSLLESTTEKGTVYLVVKLLDGSKFKECKISIDNLPFNDYLHDNNSNNDNINNNTNVSDPIINNLNNLKLYLLSNGLINNSGDRGLKYNLDSNAVCTIAYKISSGKLEFVFLSNEPEATSAITMEMNLNGNDTVTPEYLLSYNNFDISCKTKATLNVRNYNYNKDVFFTVLYSKGLRGAEIQKLSNLALKQAFLGWNILLLENVNMEMSDLGFISQN